jgi:chromosome segregation protein
MAADFAEGAQWVRADFHLHTRADREFKFTGEDNFYNSNYVDALEKAGIRLGVITNHNKFDFDEFKALRKTARKREIALLPGVELSVSDGANGIHVLVVFSDEWIDGHDYINPFLTSAFSGKAPAQYEQESGRSLWSLLQAIEELESKHRDFFLVFAHVEEPKGLWAEMDGGPAHGVGTERIIPPPDLGIPEGSHARRWWQGQALAHEDQGLAARLVPRRTGRQ